MTRTSTLESILLDQQKRVQLIFSFMTVFFLFHVLVRPFQLSYYAMNDFVKVILAYNLIAIVCLSIGFIAIPKYYASAYQRIIDSVVSRIAYFIFVLAGIGLGVFIFKIAFGYYEFVLARVVTGVFALSVLGFPVVVLAYIIDTKYDRTKLKEWSELAYWKIQKLKNPVLSNGHYQTFYTETFDLDISDYSDKKVLDIGCGPRGSLEWVPDSTVAIGLDPLAKAYLELHPNSSAMKMQLVEGYCEAIPFEDNYFDIVASFNSLDHVEHLQESAEEIQRVLKPGGLLLLICDVNRHATLTEPHSITPELLIMFFSELVVKEHKLLEASYKYRIYENIRSNQPLQNVGDQGVLVAKFTKRNRKSILDDSFLDFG